MITSYQDRKSKLIYTLCDICYHLYFDNGELVEVTQPAYECEICGETDKNEKDDN